jgi:hypothetical protein
VCNDHWLDFSFEGEMKDPRRKLKLNLERKFQ